MPDPELKYYSIEPATKFVLPRVREALAINPDLKVMISPWSPPAWMKTTNSLIQGQLLPQYYLVVRDTTSLAPSKRSAAKVCRCRC